MKIKTNGEVIELIDNMSLNEYCPQSNEEATPKEETIDKMLEARVAALLSSNGTINGTIHDFCEQAHDNGACLPTSFGLFESKSSTWGHSTINKGILVPLPIISAGLNIQISHINVAIPF